jgi:AcrR family transcriptional regulator
MAEKIIDRRVQRTRQLLLDALRELILEKGYEAITVQDLIDRANLGRSTFYSHFQDKEDLLLKGVESLWDELALHLKVAMPREDTFWSLILSMFRHAENQRSLYKALIGNQGGNLAMKHIQKELYALIYEHLQVVLGKQNTKLPLELVAYHAVSTFLSLLAWWSDSDAPYSAEQMNQFYRHLLYSGLEDLFEAEKQM